MAGLDIFIVNVALPSISGDLGAGPSELEWIVAGYALPYGVALVTGARLGDLFGRRALFLWGIGGFTLASAACGFAPSPGVLIAARVVQGLAAAAASPQVIASLTAAYSGRARARVVDAYAFTLGIAAVLGQLIGGVLLRLDIAHSGWRACFLVNIPVGIAVILAGRRYFVKVPTHPARFDPAGTGLLGAGLLLLVLPLVEGHAQGWPVWIWVCLAASAVVLTVFAGYERRFASRGGAPLVNMALFGERAFSAGMGLQLVFWMGQGAFFFVLALYCQDGLRLAPVKAGLVFLPMGLGYMITSMTARHIAARFGRQVLAAGALLMVIAEVGLILLESHVSPAQPWLLDVPLFVDGLGMGLVVGPLASTIMAGVEPKHIGAASGVFNAGLQVATAAGVALGGIVFYSKVSGNPAGDRNAFVDVLPYLIGVGVVAALLAQLLPQRRNSR
ncbi:MFS transporter [Actinoplanes sp. TBRC 11911]|nr:MFS transporter [Actinoplanes sp. TBRC 11911]